MPFYLRHPDLVVVGKGAQCTFVLPGRGPLVLDADPARVSQALKALRAPLTIDEIGEALDLRDVLRLVAHGALLTGDDAEALARRRGEAPTRDKPYRHVVLAVTGAVGAVNAPMLALHLARHMADRVDVIVTAGAQRFVRPEVFRYLGLEVWTDAFEPRGAVNVPHIFLAKADIVVVAPASAHALYELASGACGDLLALVATATRAPVVVAPSMNEAMWENAAVADNVATLRRRGVHIVEPGDGFEVSEKSDAPWAFGPATLDADAWTAILASVVAPTRPRDGA